MHGKSRTRRQSGLRLATPSRTPMMPTGRAAGTSVDAAAKQIDRHFLRRLDETFGGVAMRQAFDDARGGVPVEAFGSGQRRSAGGLTALPHRVDDVGVSLDASHCGDIEHVARL